MKLSLPPEEKKLIFESFPDLFEYLDSRLNPKSYSCRIPAGSRSPPNRSRDTLTGEARLKGTGSTTRSDGLIVVVHAAPPCSVLPQFPQSIICISRVITIFSATRFPPASLPRPSNVGDYERCRSRL